MGLAWSVWAQSEGQIQFCAKDMKASLANNKNRLAFRNSGGIQGRGVCWWHSRFLRNASYLVYFSPEKPIPENNYIKIKRKTSKVKKRIPAPGSIMDILFKIRRGREVVEVPGFSHLWEFSSHFEPEIQRVLDDWQLEDGFIKQKWVLGIKGSLLISAQKLEKMMHQTYDKFQRGELIFQRVQVKGITNHAWLVQSMRPTSDGYLFQVIDSNYLYLKNYHYTFGDRVFYDTYWGRVVPYTAQRREEKKLRRIRKKYCRSL